jgi:hypothetical protein
MDLMLESSSYGVLAAAIRDAFARGEPALGEVLFADALDDGMPWDLATRAAAQGVASRYNPALSPDQPNRYGAALN